MRTVKKYVLPVQKSVYEGFITEGKLKKLKSELLSIADTEKDSIIIYKFSGYGIPEKDILGVNLRTELYVL